MKFIQFEQTILGTEQRGKGKFMWKELVVILQGRVSCWAIAIDLLFSEEKYLIQRFVVSVSKNFHQLVFSILRTFSFTSSVVTVFAYCKFKRYCLLPVFQICKMRVFKRSNNLTGFIENVPVNASINIWSRVFHPR